MIDKNGNDGDQNGDQHGCSHGDDGCECYYRGCLDVLKGLSGRLVPLAEDSRTQAESMLAVMTHLMEQAERVGYWIVQHHNEESQS